MILMQDTGEDAARGRDEPDDADGQSEGKGGEGGGRGGQGRARDGDSAGNEW